MCQAPRGEAKWALGNERDGARQALKILPTRKRLLQQFHAPVFSQGGGARPLLGASGRWLMTAGDIEEGKRWGEGRQRTTRRLRFTAQQVQQREPIRWPMGHQAVCSDARTSYS